jgi:hypothetical protein
MDKYFRSVLLIIPADTLFLLLIEVESKSGAGGGRFSPNCFFPTLSVVCVLNILPCLRFHIPLLVTPEMGIRIRLSDKVAYASHTAG